RRVLNSRQRIAARVNVFDSPVQFPSTSSDVKNLAHVILWSKCNGPLFATVETFGRRRSKTGKRLQWSDPDRYDGRAPNGHGESTGFEDYSASWSLELVTLAHSAT